MMTFKTLAALVLAAGSAVAHAGPTAVTRTYKATFDVELDLAGGVVAQPILEIQNPKANLYSMTVTSVAVVWNPLSSSTTPLTGILKHSGARTCTRIGATNPVTLLPGDGLTVDALQSIGSCSAPVCGQTCFSLFDCPASCFCLRRPTTSGTCVSSPGSVLVPDRVTFEVSIADDTRNVPPSVQATDLIANPGGTGADYVKAVKDGEVDEDSVQK